MALKNTIKSILLKFALIKKIHTRLSWYNGKVHYFFKLFLPIVKYKKKIKKPVFLIFTPEHANLGDHAIAYAEQKMLDSIGISYYEVTNKQLEILQYYNLMSVFDGSFILVTGGGNLGSLWTWIENINRCIITENPNSTIFILPNSIYYGTEDKLYFEESRKIYNSHNSLFLYAREKLSYSFMSKAYNNVKLIPDMVLSLDYSSVDNDRRGCILCLRNDREATLTKEERLSIAVYAKSIFKSGITVSDTVLNHNVSVIDRESALLEKFNEFSHAELIITDRLHGMIFAAITGTNCIVLDSKSPKLRGCYEWIKHLDYIKFIDDVSMIEHTYHNMPKTKNLYDNKFILEQIDELKTDILRTYNS